MRLRLVQTVHFGKSEMTNFNEVLKKHPEFAKEDHAQRLRVNDVVLFVSRGNNQLIFVYGFDAFEDKRILRSRRLRIVNGRQWNPLMLVNYARSVGLEITGLKAFEEHMKGQENA